MRLAYADPPYPGQAHQYPEKTEVDHAALIQRLREYDGWALSTNENTLQHVLRLCPPAVRVLAWCKSNAPPFYGHPIASWEPVICVPARTEQPLVRVRNYLVSPAPSGFVGDAKLLIGRKSPAFCEWVIRCLGAEPADTLHDLFPGSGVMGRTWNQWQTQPPLWAVEAQQPTRRKRERVRAANSQASPE